MINDNAITTVLLCSMLGLTDKKLKPYTNIRWNELEIKITNSKFQEPSALLRASREDLVRVLEISDEEGERIFALLQREINVSFLLEELERKGINICTKSDENYPRRLKKILKKYSPPLIFYSGDLSLANTAGIAIVGSRRSDQRAGIFTHELVSLAAQQRFSVFSGGASGIDSIAEEAVLNNGGYAISIVSDSLEKKIIKKEKREKIISGHLLMMSSQLPQSNFSAWRAMDRNKYVYALSSAAFVVSSGAEKSGTFAGATENMKKGWVPTFVYDTDAYSGNKVLINKGACPVGDLSNLSFKQLIEQECSYKNQVSLFNDKTMMAEEESQTVLSLQEKNEVVIDFDLYPVILKSLLDYLSQPKSLEEIKNDLKITQSQANKWLKRAKRDKVILKQNHPVRYVSNQGTSQ